MKKSVLITGITGQMGSFMAEKLLKEGFTIIGTSRRLSVPNNANINQIEGKEKIIFELMDLGDAHSINNIVQKYKPDYFINCAANSFVGTSWDCPEQHFEFNALGVLRQLEAIRKYSPLTRYFNFGSSEEFGNVAYVPQDEQHPARARSPYGASKIAARQIVKVYRESYNLYATQGWSFNYEGTRRAEEFLTRKVTIGVAKIRNSFRTGEEIAPIELGNVNSKRDWSNCLDTADGVWMQLNQDIYNQNLAAQLFTLGLDEEEKTKWLSKNIKEYVLSSNETHSIREFVEKAFLAAGIEGRWAGEGVEERFYSLYGMSSEGIITLVKINPKFFRPAEVDLLYGNSNLIRQELGWKPKYSFDDLVTSMVKHDLSLISNKT